MREERGGKAKEGGEGGVGRRKREVREEWEVRNGR